MINDRIIFSAKGVNGIRRWKKLWKKSFHVENIDFELPAGCIMGIIGKNGAGKTTLFDYIMSEKKQYSGSFFLEGTDIHREHLWALDNIGFVSEKNEFLELRTADQNARMLGRFYSSFDMDLFEQTLEAMQLFKGKTVGKMSRGERVKFQLAFGIAHRPKLFLLDEATAGLDAVFRTDFYKLLRKLLIDESCAVLMSSHLEEEIEQQFDYIGLLEEGRFVSFTENIQEHRL